MTSAVALTSSSFAASSGITTPAPFLPPTQQPLIDDQTLGTLKAVYGSGVGKLFETYEALSLILKGFPKDQWCAATMKSTITVGGMDLRRASACYRRICQAVQVRPDSAMLRVCGAHDMLQWIEHDVPTETWSAEALQHNDSGENLVASLKKERRSAAEKEVVMADERRHRIARPISYLETIERYLFSEEVEAAEAAAKKEEEERREQAIRDQAERDAIPIIDLNLLALAEEDHRTMLAEMCAFEFARSIVGPSVSSTQRIAQSVSFSHSLMSANCMMPILVSMRCLTRLKTLSFANTQMDTPFAVLFALGPLKHDLPQLESLALDENPMGTAAVNTILRIARSHQSLSSVSILGITCDAATSRKLQTVCDDRKARQALQKKHAAVMKDLTTITESDSRRTIETDAMRQWHTIASRFYVEQHAVGSPLQPTNYADFDSDAVGGARSGANSVTKSRGSAPSSAGQKGAATPTSPTYGTILTRTKTVPVATNSSDDTDSDDY